MTPNQPPASQPRNPGAPTAPPVILDLDAQIEQVEQRLMAREAWIRSTAESLGHRAQVAVTPKPWLLPAVGAGVVLWLGWRWWHRREPARETRFEVPTIAQARHSDGLVDLPWAGLTSLAWPMVPEAWRGRLSPAAAATVVSTVLSVARRLFRRRAR